MISPYNGELRPVVDTVLLIEDEDILTSISVYLVNLIYLLELRENNAFNKSELSEIVSEQKKLDPDFFLSLDDTEDAESVAIPEDRLLKERFVNSYNSVVEGISFLFNFAHNSYQYAAIYYQLQEYCRRKAFSSRKEVMQAKEQLIIVKNIVELRNAMQIRSDQ